MMNSKKIACGLIVLTIVLGAWIRWQNLDFDREDKRNRSPDEVIYTTYASVIAHEGIRGTAISVEQYNKNEKLWILPPPTRIGYLYPLALVMKLTGRHDKDIGLFFSLAVSISSVVLITVLCLHFFDPWMALFAVVFLAVSPVELAFARKVWQDGWMTLLGGILLYLSFEILNRQKKYLWIGLFTLVGACAGLTKESGLVLFGIFGAGLVFWLIVRRHFREALFLVAVASTVSVLTLLLLAGLSGGRGPLLELYGHLKTSVAGNVYALEYQNDPWYSFLEALALLSPVSVILFGIGCLRLGIDSEKRTELSLALFAFLALMIAASIPAYFKNIRYLSPVYFPFYLIAASGLHLLVLAFQDNNRKTVSLIVGTTVLVLAVSADICNFNKIFIKKNAKDLSNPLLREASLFSPITFRGGAIPRTQYLIQDE